jgi:hypothetical protein
MPKQYFVVVGHEAIVRALHETEIDADLKVGEPRSAEGFADAVDSTLGPDEIRQIFELVSVAASTGTAVVTLLAKIKDLLKSNEAKLPAASREVKVQDARTGKVLEHVNADSDVDAMADRINESGK